MQLYSLYKIIKFCIHTTKTNYLKIALCAFAIQDNSESCCYSLFPTVYLQNNRSLEKGLWWSSFIISVFAPTLHQAKSAFSYNEHLLAHIAKDSHAHSYFQV